MDTCFASGSVLSKICLVMEAENSYLPDISPPPGEDVHVDLGIHTYLMAGFANPT